MSVPNFQKHLLYGVILGALMFALTKDPIVMVVTAIFSTLPDLDINTSTPFRFYAIATAGYAIYVILFPGSEVAYSFPEWIPWLSDFIFPQRYFAIPPLLGLIILQFVPHREWLHSLSAGLVFALPLWFFFNVFAFFGGLLGYYLHLFLDRELLDGLFT